MPDTTPPSQQTVSQDGSQVADAKPGYQTSEFWLHILAQAVLAVLGIVTAIGGPLDAIATSLAGSNPILAAVVPLAKAAILAVIAWASGKLSTAYTVARSDVKTQVAQIQANTAAQVQLPTGMTSGQASLLLAQLGQAAK